MGIERQSEIITPALSFIATSNAIRAADFKPVFCDINRETLNIDASKIEEKITDKNQSYNDLSIQWEDPAKWIR